MSIVIFLILLTSWMNFGDAAENINKRGIVGGETEQNPKDPKYQALAEDLVYHHLHVKQDDAREIFVTRVTTQVVSGIITRIQFHVLFKNGETLSCSSEIWEQAWNQRKDVSYQCTESNYPKPSGTKLISTPLEKKQPPVDHDNYHELVKEPIVNYFKNLPEHIKIQYSDIHFTTDVIIKTPVSSKNALYINADVKVSASRNFKCTAVYVLPARAPLSVKCFEDLQLIGGQRWADASQEKYLRLAEKSILKHKQLKFKGESARDIVVTFVLEQIVAGQRDTIDFVVNPVHGQEYTCHSDVWEKLNGEDVVLDVTCSLKI